MVELSPIVLEHLRANAMPANFLAELDNVEGLTLATPSERIIDGQPVPTTNFNSLELTAGNMQNAQRVMIVGAAGDTPFERVTNGLDFIRQAEGLPHGSTIPHNLPSRSAYLIFDPEQGLHISGERHFGSQSGAINSAIKKASNLSANAQHKTGEFGPLPPKILYAPGADPDALQAALNIDAYGYTTTVGWPDVASVVVDAPISATDIPSTPFHHSFRTGTQLGAWIPSPQDLVDIDAGSQRARQLQQLDYKNRDGIRKIARGQRRESSLDELPFVKLPILVYQPRRGWFHRTKAKIDLALAGPGFLDPRPQDNPHITVAGIEHVPNLKQFTVSDLAVDSTGVSPDVVLASSERSQPRISDAETLVSKTEGAIQQIHPTASRTRFRAVPTPTAAEQATKPTKR